MTKTTLPLVAVVVVFAITILAITPGVGFQNLSIVPDRLAIVAELARAAACRVFRRRQFHFDFFGAVRGI